MAVQGFLHAFDKIDKDHDHVISHEDLRTYAKENNMPDSFVTVCSSFAIACYKYYNYLYMNHPYLGLHRTRCSNMKPTCPKWISLFDDKKTGSFTYEHFCDVIGLNKKPPASPAPIPQVKKEVTYLGGPMKDPMKSRVMEIFKNEWKEEDASGSVHQTLMQLDREYGLGWRSRTFDDEHNIPKVDNVKDNWIAFSPDRGNHKYIIWQQKLKKSGGCCACFV